MPTTMEIRVSELSKSYDSLFQRTPLCDDQGILNSRAEFCVVLPETWSGARKSKNVLFVNGVGNTPDESAASAQLLSDKIREPVYRIHNDQERIPILGGAINSLLSKLSVLFGGYVEAQASKLLVQAVWANYKNDQRIEIHAHSQGSSIVHDALFLLHRALIERGQKKDWDALRKNLTVHLYGAAQHSWRELSVTDYLGRTDYIARGTLFLDRLLEWFVAWRKTFSFESAPKWLTKFGFQHSFKSYLEKIYN